jgi:hypothetical protein
MLLMLRETALFRLRHRLISLKSKERRIDSLLLSCLRRIMLLSNMYTIRRINNLRKFNLSPNNL